MESLSYYMSCHRSILREKVEYYPIVSVNNLLNKQSGCRWFYHDACVTSLWCKRLDWQNLDSSPHGLWVQSMAARACKIPASVHQMWGRAHMMYWYQETSLPWTHAIQKQVVFKRIKPSKASVLFYKRRRVLTGIYMKCVHRFIYLFITFQFTITHFMRIALTKISRYEMQKNVNREEWMRPERAYMR